MEQGHTYTYEQVEQTTNYLKSRTNNFQPKVAIICGSGLGGLSDVLRDQTTIAYEEIPNFPKSTVAGHDGTLVFGWIQTTPVICMKGRFHSYEGYVPQRCTLPVRVFRLLGVRQLIVTNAAGSVNPTFKVGDLMIIDDHLNLPGWAGFGPLIGPNDERFGPRFPSMHAAYDAKLRSLVKGAVDELKCTNLMRNGVYCMLVGPNFETRAELNALRILGADAVGMSTVHEVLAAVHCGIKVLGFSLITNACSDESLCHEEVLEVGKQRAILLQNIVIKVLERIEMEEIKDKIEQVCCAKPKEEIVESSAPEISTEKKETTNNGSTDNSSGETSP